MKVRMLSHSLKKDEKLYANQVYDLPNGRAKKMIESGQAKAIGEPPTEVQEEAVSEEAP